MVRGTGEIPDPVASICPSTYFGLSPKGDEQMVTWGKRVVRETKGEFREPSETHLG